MQIQYELLKTTLKRIFESYTWNSRQIKNSWKIFPYKNKEKKTKIKWLIIFASDTQFKIMSKVISELLNTYLALSWGTYNEMKKKKEKVKKYGRIINLLNLNSVSLAFAFNP